MSGLARWCARRRRTVIGGWVVVLLALAVAFFTVGSSFTDDTTLPDSESSTAYSLMAQAGLSGSSAGSTGNLVWRTTGVGVDDPTVVGEVSATLQQVAGMPGVASVVSPYDAAGTGQLNSAADTAYAVVTFTGTTDQADAVVAAMDHLDSATLQVAAGGTAFTAPVSPGGPAEGLGIVAALLVLLLVFRSPWAAGLPILTGVVGVGVSSLALLVLSNVVDLSSNALTMGSLIGLGVGIDYALFIVNRHRKALMAGTPVAEAVVEAVTTSGRAVVFAGLTVVVALLGVFVVGIDVLTGMARGAALVVVVTVLSATTLLPALLSVLGTRVLSRKQRAALAAGARAEAPRGAGVRWAALVQRFPVRLGVLAAIVLIALAVPATQLRLGTADASSEPAGSSAKTYDTMMARGFGDGYDAGLVLVAKTPDAASVTAFDTLATRVATVADVTAATAVPAADGATVRVLSVTPASSAQTAATADLVHALRDDVVPAAEDGTTLRVYVGGATATSLDNADLTLSKLPLYLALVAGLGFVLLVVAFRSVLVPLVGALGNLLTLAVALGGITAVFQLGYGSELLQVGGGAPIESLVPVMVIGVMFGLSMDYQVFLVSRMHEEWTRTRDNARAVRVGHAETSRVIVTAATIMLCVFMSFGLSGQRIVSTIGVGLAIGVLVDAFVLRLVLVPAVMHVIGARNWSYPRWAERLTPHLSVEGSVPAAEALGQSSRWRTAGPS